VKYDKKTSIYQCSTSDLFCVLYWDSMAHLSVYLARIDDQVNHDRLEMNDRTTGIVRDKFPRFRLIAHHSLTSRPPS
jgi:hypothetical protein